jgi:hypothetical protein
MNELEFYLYHHPFTSSAATIKLKQKSRHLKRSDDPANKSPVTCIERDPYYSMGSLRWWIAEKDCPAGKPERRRPGLPGRID